MLKPAGKLVIVDYSQPPLWNPFRLVMVGILAALEPFALAFWRRDIADCFPPRLRPTAIRQRTVFGGLYRLVEIDR